MDKELKRHLQALGLSDEKSYVRWCKAQGFSTGLNKSDNQRKKELQHIKELSLQNSMAHSRQRLRTVSEQLRYLLDNPQEINRANYEVNYLERACPPSLKKDQRSEFYNFLWQVNEVTDLLDRGGPETQNYLTALGRIFNYRLWWKRQPQDFHPSTKNAERQFSQLLRWLFTEYKLPLFLDKLWLTNNDLHHEWFLWLAEGHNLRKAPKLPVTLTKKQAHLVMEAPDSYSMLEALRYGQVLGLGGDKRLVQALIGSRLRDSFQNNDFWETVIQFFIQQPMLDRVHVGPIIDYIQHIKYGANGHAGFSMRARDPQMLLRDVDQWHTQLRRTRKQSVGAKTWAPCGINPFFKEVAQGRAWFIEELNSQEGLQSEGAAMRHCVASYHGSASSGRCSIWSLKYCGERRVTIEVINDSRSIVQVRGRFNAPADTQSWSIIQEWAAHANLQVACRQTF